MFSRLAKIKSHLSRPLASISPSISVQNLPSYTRSIMTRRSDGLISTAGCVIIGDEVLGGKTQDTNSNFFAKYCFEQGISLKRIEVIPDDEEDIINTVRRMSDSYDFVITSGGIGPTHDDITYSSIAKAFSLPLTLHEDSFQRMKDLAKDHPRQKDFDWETPSDALTAKKRMIELPLDKSKPMADQVVFTSDELWVPLCIVNGNVHILPGVPRLFTQMLDGYKSILKAKLADQNGQGDYRVLISTPMPESEVAAYLTKIASTAGPHGVKVGSYPRWGKKRNTVTLVGKDRAYIDSIAPDVEKMVDGKIVATEAELDSEGEEDNQS